MLPNPQGPHSSWDPEHQNPHIQETKAVKRQDGVQPPIFKRWLEDYFPKKIHHPEKWWLEDYFPI